tara:strand:+ start:1773 stop:2789 length:1017 start_codon:yes stop_codon:yes gene_type:complete
MIKKIILIYILILSYSLIASKEVYGLKDSYEVNVQLNGSDKGSIEEGMQEALKKLIVRVTGSTEISSSSKLNKVYRNPEQYINQYKLSSSDEAINAKFFFEGNKIRNFLSENKLPLWLSSESIVMAYIPCDLKSSLNLSDTDERDSCNSLKTNLSILSEQRVVELAYPILDFRDLNYLDSLSSVSYTFFMNKLINRYSLDSWIVCFIRDEFGVIAENAECISSISNKMNNLDETFNNLINSINSTNSLVVNKKVKTNSNVSIEGVFDYLTLEKVTEELRSQIIVIDLNLEALSKVSIDFEISSYGTVEDLENLLDINSNFISLKNSSDNRLIYKYIEI